MSLTSEVGQNGSFDDGSSSRRFSIAVENIKRNKKISNEPLTAYLMYLTNKKSDAIDRNLTLNNTTRENIKLNRSNSCPVVIRNDGMNSKDYKEHELSEDDNNLLKAFSRCIHDDNDCDICLEVNSNIEDENCQSDGAEAEIKYDEDYIKLETSDPQDKNYIISNSYRTPPISPKSAMIKLNKVDNSCNRHHHRRSTVALKFLNPKQIESWDDVNSNIDFMNDSCQDQEKDTNPFDSTGGIFKSDFQFGCSES